MGARGGRRGGVFTWRAVPPGVSFHRAYAEAALGEAAMRQGSITFTPVAPVVSRRPLARRAAELARPAAVRVRTPMPTVRRAATPQRFLRTIMAVRIPAYVVALAVHPTGAGRGGR